MPGNQKKKILILGGGFAGVKCALELSRKCNIENTKIVLVSDRPHFEYHGALYRLVSGGSPLEVCIPLREIFKDRSVEVLEDYIKEGNLKKKILKGESGSVYQYDYLVLAVGSQTAFFNIPGLEDLSFGVKTITEALRLKRHIHRTFTTCATGSTEDKICATRIVVVGGGATGTELAGDLALYARAMAKKMNIAPSFVSIDLIEAAPRLLPSLSEKFTDRIETKLRSLGVNIFLNRTLMENEVEKVYLKDMELKSKTVIWTAGVKANKLYAKLKDFALDKRGRGQVDKYLQAKGYKNVFILGDGASTTFSGMAQTALRHGDYVAGVICNRLHNKKMKPYVGKEPAYAIPVGPGWAAYKSGKFQCYGRLGWFFRRYLDWKVFRSILPLNKALTAFSHGGQLCENCGICSVHNKLG